PLLTVSNAPRERSGHDEQGQEREEDHGEEARAEDAEGEAAGKEGQAVTESGPADPAARGTRKRLGTPSRRATLRLPGASRGYGDATVRPRCDKRGPRSAGIGRLGGATPPAPRRSGLCGSHRPCLCSAGPAANRLELAACTRPIAAGDCCRPLLLRRLRASRA